MPEFVSKQKASSQTGIRIIHTLQIACQHHRPTEREKWEKMKARRRMEVEGGEKQEEDRKGDGKKEMQKRRE